MEFHMLYQELAAGVEWMGRLVAGHWAGMKVIAIPDPRFPPAPDKLNLADLTLPSLIGFSLELIHQLETLSSPAQG